MPDPRPAWVLTRRHALGHRIALWRAARGWTVEELAHAAEVHRTSVIRAENGAVSTGLDVLLQLADALGVSVETMLGQDPPR
ncbi:helix-turn-helix domain-containing protein [Streptomyces sp. NPDC004031]